MRRLSLLIFVVGLCSHVSLESKAEPISFANFGVYVGSVSGGGGTGKHAGGPFPWVNDPALSDEQLDTLAPFPGWDQHVVWDYQFEFTGPFDPGPEGVLTGPFASHSTMAAHGEDGTVLGTLVLEGQGSVSVDFRPDSALVDEQSGLVLRKYWNTVSGFDEPVETYTIVESTGVFEDMRAVGPWVLYAAGNNVLWRNPNLDLEANLDTEFSFAAVTPFVVTGAFEFVPEPSSLGLMIVAIGSGLLCCLRRSRCRHSGTAVQ